MLCSKCGKENPDNYLYCMGCGSELFAITEEDLTDWTVPADDTPTEKVDKKSLPRVRFIGFGESVQNFFRNYANFKGRATRSEYWFAMLFCSLYEIAALIVGMLIAVSIYLIIPITSEAMHNIYYTVYCVLCLVLACPSYALIWRRLHDTGHSGAMYFLGLIPIANLIVTWWICFASSDGDNKYGPRKVEAPSGVSPDLYS